jgi:hypothetical protein
LEGCKGIQLMSLHEQTVEQPDFLPLSKWPVSYIPA